MYTKHKTTPLFQSLSRPILLLGGERENVIVLACLCLSLCTVGRDAIAVGIALALWFAGIMLSKVMAKKDPWATKVFLRSLMYQEYYPARERLIVPASLIKRSRKI